MNQNEQNKKLNQVIAKCWADERFKRKLLADAAGVLKAEGVKVPVGQSIKVLENTDKLFHLVIPVKPTELTEADLKQVSGGFYGFAQISLGKRPGLTLEPISGESADAKHKGET
jgi:hypothetical protein